MASPGRSRIGEPSNVSNDPTSGDGEKLVQTALTAKATLAAQPTPSSPASAAGIVKDAVRDALQAELAAHSADEEDQEDSDSRQAFRQLPTFPWNVPEGDTQTEFADLLGDATLEPIPEMGSLPSKTRRRADNRTQTDEGHARLPWHRTESLSTPHDILTRKMHGATATFHVDLTTLKKKHLPDVVPVDELLDLLSEIPTDTPVSASLLKEVLKSVWFTTQTEMTNGVERQAEKAGRLAESALHATERLAKEAKEVPSQVARMIKGELKPVHDAINKGRTDAEDAFKKVQTHFGTVGERFKEVSDMFQEQEEEAGKVRSTFKRVSEVLDVLQGELVELKAEIEQQQPSSGKGQQGTKGRNRKKTSGEPEITEEDAEQKEKEVLFKVGDLPPLSKGSHKKGGEGRGKPQAGADNEEGHDTDDDGEDEIHGGDQGENDSNSSGSKQVSETSRRKATAGGAGPGDGGDDDDDDDKPPKKGNSPANKSGDSSKKSKRSLLPEPRQAASSKALGSKNSRRRKSEMSGASIPQKESEKLIELKPLPKRSKVYDNFTAIKDSNAFADWYTTARVQLSAMNAWFVITTLPPEDGSRDRQIYDSYNNRVFIALHNAVSPEQQQQLLDCVDEPDSARQSMEMLQAIYLSEGDNDRLVMGKQVREIMPAPGQDMVAYVGDVGSLVRRFKQLAIPLPEGDLCIYFALSIVTTESTYQLVDWQEHFGRDQETYRWKEFSLWFIQQDNKRKRMLEQTKSPEHPPLGWRHKQVKGKASVGFAVQQQSSADSTGGSGKGHSATGTDEESSSEGTAYSAGGAATKYPSSPRKEGVNRKFGNWNFRQSMQCPFCKKFGHTLDRCFSAPKGWEPVTEVQKEMAQANAAIARAEIAWVAEQQLEPSEPTEAKSDKLVKKGRAALATAQEEENEELDA